MQPVPYQLIAKGYTEALGRNPSPTELVSHQQALACTEASIGNWMAYMLQANEPQQQNLTPRQKVQTAYHLMLNRPPDQAGWNYYETLPFPKAIADIRRAPEYRANILKMCSGKGAGYGWGVTPLDSTMPDTALRQQLAAAIPGQVVWAAGRIAVTSPLVIPPGVTLRSIGDHYTQQATLVRSGKYLGGMVQLSADSRLETLVVDGARANHGYVEQAMNIEVLGSNALVRNVRSINPTGWTALFVSPHTAAPVENVTIVGNTMIGYGGSREGKTPQWSDGISLAGKSADVRYNYVMDFTDVGIIMFDVNERHPANMVANNLIVNTGNNIFAMIGADQLSTTPGDFSRSTFGGNLLATMGQTKARVGITDGVRTWEATKAPMRGVNYAGNFGYVQWELFGFVTDGGLRSDWEPQVNFLQMAASMKKGCAPLKYAVTGLDRTEGCL
jgi:hypothetical protein